MRQLFQFKELLLSFDMHSSKPIVKKVFTFCQWKGKGYAVFASIGKSIRIGQLSFVIAQNFYSKSKSQLRDIIKGETKQVLKEDFADLDPSILELLLAELFTFQPAYFANFNIHPSKNYFPLGCKNLFIFLIKVRFLLFAGNGLF